MDSIMMNAYIELQKAIEPRWIFSYLFHLQAVYCMLICIFAIFVAPNDSCGIER